MRHLAIRTARALRLVQPTKGLELTARQRRNFYAGWAAVPPVTTFCSIKMADLATLAVDGPHSAPTSPTEYLGAWLLVALPYPGTIRLLLQIQERRRQRRQRGETEAGAATEATCGQPRWASLSAGRGTRARPPSNENGGKGTG